jgi:hypothetical protein
MRAYFSQNKKFDYALAAALTRSTDLALTKVKAVMYRALEYAARTSPQYTGTYASNWRLSIGAPKSGNNDWHGKAFGLSEGDPQAVNEAINARGNKLSGLRSGQAVFLSTRGLNKEDGEDYTWDIESNIMKFRDVNPSKGAVVARTIIQMKRYIQEVKAAKIRGVK